MGLCWVKVAKLELFPRIPFPGACALQSTLCARLGRSSKAAAISNFLHTEGQGRVPYSLSTFLLTGWLILSAWDLEPDCSFELLPDAP